MTKETNTKPKFTKKGQIIKSFLNTVDLYRKEYERLVQEKINFELVASTEKSFTSTNKVLVQMKDDKGNINNLGYIKLSFEELVGEGVEPKISDIKVTKLHENEAIGTTRMDIEFILENSIEFLKYKERDIIVQLKGSVVAFPSFAEIASEIKEVLKNVGKIQKVSTKKKGDSIVAVYNGQEFAKVITNEDNIDLINELISEDNLFLDIIEADRTSFKAKVLKPQDLELLSAKERLSQVIDEVLSRKILTEDEVNERLHYLENCQSVTKEQIVQVFEFINSIEDDEIKNLKKDETPENLYLDFDGVVGDILHGIFVDDNILLVGPKSVGKNVAIGTMAWLLLLPIGEITLNPSTTNENLYGADKLISENNVPVTKFELSALMSAYVGSEDRFASGGIALADEINAAPSATMFPLQSGLDDRRAVEVPNYRKVYKHKRSRFFGTMNPNYLGTRPLNEAIEDRFNTILYMENGIDMLKLLKYSFGDELNYDIAKKLSSLYKNFFDMVTSMELDDAADLEVDDKVLTIRGFKSAYKKAVNGQDLSKAIQVSVINKVRDKEIRESLMNIVNDILG